MDRICAVVVTYQPDLELLRENLLACRVQVDCLILVDNGSNVEVRKSIEVFSQELGCKVLQLGENLGVAAAQNHGIAQARIDGCNFVVLLDQDSSPAPGMVSALQRAGDELTARGISFAAVGPRLVDRRTGVSAPFLRLRIFGTSREICAHEIDCFVVTDFLISSGMLVSLTILDRVGLPEERLFIDNVDMEWCFRARSMDLPVYGVCNAVMVHSVGDEVFQVGSHSLHRHKPLRQYYIMRNRILLYRRSYSPWGWIVQDFFRMLFKILIFSLFFAPRFQNIYMMARGIKDGLTGTTGKFR